VTARKVGLPTKDVGLLTAATWEHGRVLVAGNAVHFAGVPGLVIEDVCHPQPADAPRRVLKGNMR
jgi:hypothetical protein